MEFHVKLQELRKQNGLTQEELAKKLFVSRTAVSKWESNRGYPGIESLKNISKLFSVSLDDLLSNEELLSIAEESGSKKTNGIIDLIFGLSDLSTVALLLLPLFALRQSNAVYDVSLIELNSISLFIKVMFYIFVITVCLFGVLMLTLQNSNCKIWIKAKSITSVALSIIGTLMFTVCLQPYAAIYMFLFFIIKVLILLKITRHE